MIMVLYVASCLVKKKMITYALCDEAKTFVGDVLDMTLNHLKTSDEAKELTQVLVDVAMKHAQSSWEVQELVEVLLNVVIKRGQSSEEVPKLVRILLHHSYEHVRNSYKARNAPFVNHNSGGINLITGGRGPRTVWRRMTRQVS